MGINSYLYLSKGSMPNIRDIENILTKEGYVIERVVPHNSKNFPRFFNKNVIDFEFAYFYFDNGDYLMTYPYNGISGGDRDKTEPYTISGNVNDFTHKALKVIASYYGGHFEENDCDESVPEDWIPKTKSLDVLEVDKLENLIYRNLNYKDGSIVYKFMMENEDLLRDYFRNN